jgi:hypothetical protein
MSSIQNHVQALDLFSTIVNGLQEQNPDLRRALMQGQQASRLIDRSDWERWCDREVNGYPNEEQIPAYRRGRGELRWQFDGDAYTSMRAVLGGDTASDEPPEYFAAEYRMGILGIIGGVQQGVTTRTQNKKPRRLRSSSTNTKIVQVQHYPAIDYSSIVTQVQQALYKFALESLTRLRREEEDFTPEQRQLAATLRGYPNAFPSSPAAVPRLSSLDAWFNTEQDDRLIGGDMRLFDGMPSDMITLYKQGGETIEGIKAIVQSKIIVIEDTVLPIEEGDTITRTLPNGLTERYKVLDRGYQAGIRGGIEPHYQVKVQKESAISSENHAQTIYNVTGPNARINQNSVDASVNLVNTTSDDLFSKMRSALAEGIEDEEKRQKVLEQVNALEEAKGTPRFLERYTSFVAILADHVGLIQAFLPALMQLVQQ